MWLCFLSWSTISVWTTEGWWRWLVRKFSCSGSESRNFPTAIHQSRKHCTFIRSIFNAINLGSILWEFSLSSLPCAHKLCHCHKNHSFLSDDTSWGTISNFKVINFIAQYIVNIKQKISLKEKNEGTGSWKYDFMHPAFLKLQKYKIISNLLHYLKCFKFNIWIFKRF